MDFEQFYNTLLSYPSLKSVFSAYDIIINFSLPALLMIPVAYVYTKTHRGVTFNQYFTHTMFVMAVTVSVIMMIIGSNIARAFSLVGALSIIRFRTAVKDTKDTGYIFAAIAIGMATGTGMYMVACIFSILFCILMLLLNTLKVGQKIYSDKLLKLEVTAADFKAGDLDKLILDHARDFSLIHSEQVTADKNLMTFIISTKSTDDDQKLLESIKTKLDTPMASIFYNDQRIEI